MNQPTTPAQLRWHYRCRKGHVSTSASPHLTHCTAPVHEDGVTPHREHATEPSRDCGADWWIGPIVRYADVAPFLPAHLR
jgi:hypothetical protein